MSIKNDAILIAGIALAAVFLANQAKDAASRAIQDARDAAAKAVNDAWDAATRVGTQAIAATVETVTPAGAGLYDQRPAASGAPKTQFTLGSIEDGTIY